MRTDKARRGQTPQSARASAPNTPPVHRTPFDPNTFLAKVGAGRSILEYRKNRVVFGQGDKADTVFDVRKGKAELSVVSAQGKEAVVAILGVEAGKRMPFTCPYHCLVTCDYLNRPYCIALALINAQRGRMGHGFAFAGENAHRATEIVSVKDLVSTLLNEYHAARGQDCRPAGGNHS